MKSVSILQSKRISSFSMIEVIERFVQLLNELQGLYFRVTHLRCRMKFFIAGRNMIKALLDDANVSSRRG